MNDSDLTPLMRQYREIKRAYEGAIVFFRVGDFYEMFYEDAEEASRLLSIALTSRDKSSATPVPLCGVPYHAATAYIAKLLKAGRTVALCDQVEDPKLARGLVRREVVRLYTPGTLTDAELLRPAESNFLAAVTSAFPSSDRPAVGLAALDLSPRGFWVAGCGRTPGEPPPPAPGRGQPGGPAPAGAARLRRRSPRGARLSAKPREA